MATVRAFVRWAGEGQFTTYIDPEYTFRNMVDVSAPERPPAFEGFSGGPAFVIPADGLLVVPHLCGIVKEGGVSSLAPGRSPTPEKTKSPTDVLAGLLPC